MSISIKITLWRSSCTLCFFIFNKYFLYVFIFMIQTNLEALSEMSQSEANTIDLTLSLLWITPGSTILYCNLILNKWFCWLPKSSGQRSPATVELFYLHLCLQYQFIYLVVFIFRKQKNVISMRLRLSLLEILVVTKNLCDSSNKDGTAPAFQTCKQTLWDW